MRRPVLRRRRSEAAPVIWRRHDRHSAVVVQGGIVDEPRWWGSGDGGGSGGSAGRRRGGGDGGGSGGGRPRRRRRGCRAILCRPGRPGQRFVRRHAEGERARHPGVNVHTRHRIGAEARRRRCPRRRRWAGSRAVLSAVCRVPRALLGGVPRAVVGTAAAFGAAGARRRRLGRREPELVQARSDQRRRRPSCEQPLQVLRELERGRLQQHAAGGLEPMSFVGAYLGAYLAGRLGRLRPRRARA